MAIKVLHIFHSINHSGAEIMYASAASIFIDAGFDLYALSTGESKGTYIETFKQEGFKIFHMPLQRNWGLKYYLTIIPYCLKFYKLVREEKFEIIHIHRNHLFWLYALIAKIAGISTIIRTVHNVFRPRFYRYPSYLISRHFARLFLGVKITSIGNSVLLNEKNRFFNKTILINNWYDDNIFRPIKNFEIRKGLRNRLKIKESDFVIISVGSCLPQKRHKDILLMLNELNRNHENIIYLHLGEGDLEQEEKDIARKLAIKNVVFLGNVDNVVDYLNISDVFIMPSDFEGLPLSAVEAMAVELPVILYNSPGLRDLLDYKNSRGMLINNSVRDLVKAVSYLYSNKNIATDMGKKASEYVRENYSMQQSVEKFIALYKNGNKI